MPRPLLVLGAFLVLAPAACSDDDAVTVASTTMAPAPVPTGQEPTADERTAIAALAAIGLPADRAEHPGPRGAALLARSADGVFVLVNSHPSDLDPGGVTVSHERTIAGVAVATVDYASAPGLRTRFGCGDLTYEITGEPGHELPVPQAFADHDDLVARLIAALDC